MRVTLCAVGRMKSGPERDLIETYSKRISWPFSIVEVEERQKRSPAEIKTRESALLDAALPDGAIRIILDERGRTLGSREFAAKIGTWRDQGRDIAFAIGGADGHSAQLRDTADLLLSFGSNTWPHMLARAMLVEQIYRAQEILAGNPYHRD